MGQEQSTMQQPDDRNSERFSSAPSYKEINEERVKRSKNPQGNNLRQQGSLSSGVNTDGNEDPDRIKDFRPGRTNAAGPSNLAARSVNQQPNQTMSTLNDDQRDPESAKKRAAPPSAQAASSNNNKTTAHFGYAESGQFGVAEPVYSQQNNHDYPDNNASQDLLAQQQQQQYQWEQQQQQQPLYDERKREIIEKLLYNDPSLMESQTSKKIYTAEESQQLVHRLLEKGKQIETRNHLTTDYYDQREIENCTFQPNTVPESITLARSQSPKRSLQEFLNGQNKFLANRQENLKRVQTEIEYQEKQACSHAPQILQTSPIVMIQSKAARKYDSEPAYKRLFDLQKRKADAQKSKQQQKTEDDAAASKSTAKKPNPKTIDRLYNLGKKKVASKREGKPMESQNKEEKNEEQDQKQSQQQHQSVSKQIAQINQPSQKQSEFCLATKLIKEYEHIVSIVVEDAKKQAYLLDYIQMSEILRLMGFVSFTEKVESHNFVKERTLVNDMWIVLDGSQNGGVSYRNILLFIFALMGIDIDLPKFKKNEDNIITIHPSKDHAFPLLRDVAELKREEVQEQIDQIQQLRASRLSQNQGIAHSQTGSMYNIEEANLNARNNNKERPKIDYEVNGNLKSWVSQRSNELRIGSFDSERNLILTAAEVKHIQVLFYLFYVNRLHTEKQKAKYLNQQDNNLNSNRNHLSSVTSESKLKMSSPQQTEILAQNYRNRMWEQTAASNEKLQRLGDRIQHADILMAQKEEQQKYLEQIKEARRDDELLECTFHPKTNNYTKMVSPYSSQQHNFSSQQQHGTDFTDPNAMLSATGGTRPNNNPMPPTAVGTKRYLDLYNLAKPRSQLRDKKTHEVEYEKNCDECTFNPDTGASNGPRNFREVDVKNKDVTIDRMRKAYEDNQTFQLKMSRGYYEFKDQRYKNTGSVQGQYQSGGKNTQLKRPFTGDNNRVNSGLQAHQYQQEPNSHRSGSSNNFKGQQQQQDGPSDYYPERYQDHHDGYQEHYDLQGQEGHDEHGLVDGVPQFGQHHQLNEEHQGDEEHQQNYDWMTSSEGKNIQKHPLLFVDINLAPDKLERVVIYEGDRPEDLAREFIEKHGIDQNFHEKLTQMLEEQIIANQLQQSQN